MFYIALTLYCLLSETTADARHRTSTKEEPRLFAYSRKKVLQALMIDIQAF